MILYSGLTDKTGVIDAGPQDTRTQQQAPAAIMPYKHKTSGIYAICSSTTGRKYIGSSSRIQQRWSEHRRSLRNGDHPNIHLQRAWNKYGEDSFEFVVLEECPVELLFEREQYHFDQTPSKYNLTAVAESSLGTKRSAETRARISASKMGNKNASGHVKSAETREKCGAANKGNTHRVGAVASPETREKIRQAAKGRPVSVETRAKLSAAAKAQWERRRVAEDQDEANGLRPGASSTIQTTDKPASA
jgi:group I intron endonuclease